MRLRFQLNISKVKTVPRSSFFSFHKYLTWYFSWLCGVVTRLFCIFNRFIFHCVDDFIFVDFSSHGYSDSIEIRFFLFCSLSLSRTFVCSVSFFCVRFFSMGFVCICCFFLSFRISWFNSTHMFTAQSTVRTNWYVCFIERDRKRKNKNLILCKWLF